MSQIRISKTLGNRSGGSFTCANCGKVFPGGKSVLGKMTNFGSIETFCPKCSKSPHFITCEVTPGESTQGRSVQ